MHLHVMVAEEPDHLKPFTLKKLDKKSHFKSRPNRYRQTNPGSWPGALRKSKTAVFLIFQINMLLTFSTGDDCPCPSDIQEELYDFHNQLQLHCGRTVLPARLSKHVQRQDAVKQSS